jgi:peptide/nickel transport system permease protein
LPVGRLSRLLATLGLLLASTFAVFALLEAAPGGPMAAYRGDSHLAASDITMLDREFGVGRPFYAQYFAWLFRMLHGDLGWSTTNAQPVSKAIVERLPATIELVFFSLVAAVVLGAIAGAVRARSRASMPFDFIAVPLLVSRATPIAILVLFLQLLLVFTQALPVAGIASVDGFDLRDRFSHLVVPVLCLAVPFGAWSSLIFYDFFRASKGALRSSVRSIAGPVITTVALIGPALVAASLLVEPMFAWPGVGRSFRFALSQFDLGVIAGVLLLYSVGVALMKLFADVSPGVGDWTSRHGLALISASGRKGFSALGVIACIVLLGAAFGAVTANLIAPIGPIFIDMPHWRGYPLPPGVAGHVLGTDENGRDLFSRLLVGLRTSLGIAAFAAVAATAIGALVAFAAKAVPWFNDRAALSLTGIRPFAALPYILAVVAVLAAKFHTVAFLNPLGIALIIAAVMWPAASPAFRMFSPATLGGFVDLTACALLLEVTVSLLGFGIQPPTPSLGNLLVNAQSNIAIAPWVPIVPAVVVVVTLFALYAIADELRAIGVRPS